MTRLAPFVIILIRLIRPHQARLEAAFETAFEATLAPAPGASFKEQAQPCDVHFDDSLGQLLGDIRRKAKLSHRLNLREMAHEIVPALLHKVARITKAMTRIGQHQEVEIFLSVDERLHH